MCHQEQIGNDDSKGATDFAMPDCCGPTMDRSGDADKEEKASNWWSGCEEMMKKMTEGEDPMASCPMAAMFKRSSGKRGFGLLAVLPGLLLVLGGVAIILEPQILVWLIAATSIVAGLMFLAVAAFFGKTARNFSS